MKLTTAHLTKRQLFYWMGEHGKGELYHVTQVKLGGCLAKRYIEANGKEKFIGSGEEIELCPIKLERKENART